MLGLLTRGWVVYAEVPDGQISFHVPDRLYERWFSHLPVKEASWDGHDTPEKWRRAHACPDLTPVMKGVVAGWLKGEAELKGGAVPT